MWVQLARHIHFVYVRNIVSGEDSKMQAYRESPRQYFIVFVSRRLIIVRS